MINIRHILLVSSVSFLPIMAFPQVSFAHSHCDILNPAHISVDNRTSISNFKSKEAFRFCERFLAIDSQLDDYTPENTKGTGTYADIGRYGWNASRVLRAYHDMYEVTGDIHFLEKMIEDIDVIASNSQLEASFDEQGTDYYGWPTDHNQKGPDSNPYKDPDGNPYYVRKAVINGMILYPIAKLVETLKENPELNDQLATEFQNREVEYLTLITNVINTLNDRFCYGYEECGSVDADGKTASDKVNADDDEAFYYIDANDIRYEESFRNWSRPNNHHLAMGSVFAVMWALDNEDSVNLNAGVTINDYRGMAKGLGRAFRNDLELETAANTGNEFYKWGYWWGQNKDRCGSCYKDEDLGHGTIDIEYVIELRKQGLNIGNSNNPFPWANIESSSSAIKDNDTELMRFANTFTDVAYLGNLKFSNRVNGETTGATNNYLDDTDLNQVMRYLDLAEWDNDFLAFNFTTSESDAEDYQVINNASIPNKLYSIVKCTFDEKLHDRGGRTMLQGVAKLTKWAHLLNDNDNRRDREIRCNTIKNNPDEFYSEYMNAYISIINP